MVELPCDWPIEAVSVVRSPKGTNVTTRKRLVEISMIGTRLQIR